MESLILEDLFLFLRDLVNSLVVTISFKASARHQTGQRINIGYIVCWKYYDDIIIIIRV